ncbi:uncharacterized protein N7498_009447 [Penicillium cinerascens]|uniref:Uncharacterized protein n=1 Tax=Penicillium cinerascens TaxID=70096 RepID=A0A9W9M800_9EURO|nr:uncharacterized protein N7498_009447 [Penicillium cinerascens]KAJ5190462.1 hypothetical protein N7498_009447 [Penicillium cinerascens]
MPLIVPKRNTYSHVNLPIALFTTVALVTALLYLQLVYGISWLLRPFYNSSQEFPPLRRTIERTEKLTVNIILSIVPTSFYRSPPVSDFFHMHEDSALRVMSGPRYAYENPSHTQQSQPTTVIPATLLQCYPENSVERMDAITYEPRLPVRANIPDRHAHARESFVYDTVKKYATMGKQRISVVEMHRSTQNVSQSYTQKQVETAGPQPTVPVLVSPQPYQKSPAASFDGAREASMHSFPTEIEDSTNSMTLRMNRRSKSRSTESYPGKFPVSDGLEYSNLATASLNFRERGTTSVRPFSDY